MTFCRQELSSFDDQPDVICHVALVKAKPSVFVEAVAHVIVICMPESVSLIGVSSSPATTLSGRVHKNIELYATDMSVSTPVEMHSVVGSADGRIFMVGDQDGHLYELHYQQSESWFGKRVQLINHSIGGVGSLFPRLASSKNEGVDPLRIFNIYIHNLFIRSYYIAGVGCTTTMLLRSNDKEQRHNV